MMTSTSTSTTTHTRTHTATHLADVLMSTIAQILISLGIDTTRYFDRIQVDERAVKAWIEEGSLKALHVECTSPSGTLLRSFQFDIAYTAANVGDTAFTNTQAQIMRYMAKVGSVPVGTSYRLVCTFNFAHSTQDGWNKTKLASTAELANRSIGTLASGPHASASTRIYS